MREKTYGCIDYFLGCASFCGGQLSTGGPAVFRGNVMAGSNKEIQDNANRSLLLLYSGGDKMGQCMLKMNMYEDCQL